MKSSKVLQDISSNVEGKMSNCDARNWVSYVNGFRKCFKQLEVEVADLRRFPTDQRDGNGFWIPFNTFKLHGSFECPAVSNCNWVSKDVQVDLMIRYNVIKKVGELKIGREYRQRCPKHGGYLVNPLISEKEAQWIMNKAMLHIRKKFYFDIDQALKRKDLSGGSKKSFENTSISPPKSSNSSSRMRASGDESNSNIKIGQNSSTSRYIPDHERNNCEACMLKRCPFPPRILRQQFIIPGRKEQDARRHLTVLGWCLLNQNSDPTFVMEI